MYQNVKKAGACLMASVMTLGMFTGCLQRGGEPGAAFDPAVTATYGEEEFIYVEEGLVPMAAAPAADTVKNKKAEIDASTAKDGYFRARSLQQTNKALRVIVKTPGAAQYTYTLKSTGEYEVFPFSDGNGNYSISVYEQVEGNKYAVAVTASQNVALASEFAPFLRANQFVNYTQSSQTVKKAAELLKGKTKLVDKISVIYDYVVKNIAYDKKKAAGVQSGYLPNVDAVLASKTGICFDYAAVMAAMLRSQGVPTKLVIGYTGQVYHAWINVYSAETGWVNNAIQFDGKTWKLMDPTYASTGNQSPDVMQYIGNGKNYTAKYVY